MHPDTLFGLILFGPPMALCLFLAVFVKGC